VAEEYWVIVMMDKQGGTEKQHLVRFFIHLAAYHKPVAKILFMGVTTFWNF
jgi:hypothetical protein